ncbi:HD domain-containing protein, partial [Staphylococcus arlettae]
MKLLEPEKIIHVLGDVINYRGRKQMKINKFRLATPEDNMKTQYFVGGAPLTPDQIQEEISHYMLEIENANLQRITRHLIRKYQDAFFTFPAASSHHHNFASGLSYHVLTMLQVAKSICDIYPLLNRSLLYSSIILHDLGKVRELSGPVATTYTVEGNLLGHISIASEEVSEAAKELNIEGEEIMLLKHMILAHHGKMEFGSPKLPHIKEAEILFFIDNIDAKMNMFEKAYNKTEKGQFTERIFGLDGRQFYKPTTLD